MIEFKATSDMKQVLADMGKLQAQLEKQERTIDKLKAKTTQHKTETSKLERIMRGAFDPTRIASFAAGFLSASQALSSYTREIERMKQMQDEALQGVMSLDVAQRQLKANMAGASDSEILDTLKQINELSKNTGVSEVALTQAMSAAVTAAGGDVTTAAGAVQQAAGTFGYDPEAMKLQATAMIDLSKALGESDMKVLAGYLATVGKLSRVDDPAKQAESIPKALAGTSSLGWSGQEGGAMFAALGSFMADPEGRTTGTAVISLASELEKYFAGSKGARLDKRLGREATATDMIRSLWRNPKEAEKFFGGGEGFEKKAQGPLRNLLLDPNSAVAKAFRENLGGFGTNEELTALSEDITRQMGMGDVATVASRERARQAALERSKTGATGEASEASNYQTYMEVLKKTRGATGGMIDRMLTSPNMSDQQLLNRLVAERNTLARQDTNVGGGGSPETIAYLDEQIALLRRAVEGIEGLRSDVNAPAEPARNGGEE